MVKMLLLLLMLGLLLLLLRPDFGNIGRAQVGLVVNMSGRSRIFAAESYIRKRLLVGYDEALRGETSLVDVRTTVWTWRHR